MRYDELLTALDAARKQYESKIGTLIRSTLKGEPQTEVGKALHWTQTPKGRKIMAARTRKAGKKSV